MSIKTKKILIVGGGSAGWMTAASLIRAFPNRKIIVIESKDVPILGVGESTLGGIKRWTNFIGLDEQDFFKYTDASYKMSIKFTDFYEKDAGAFHYPFGKPLIDDRSYFGFNDWHLKKYFYPDTPLQDFVQCLFPSAALFENNKFSLNNFGDFDNYNPATDVAYHFDAVKFGMWLKNRYCIPRGVEHIEATVEDIEVDDNGIKNLTLDNGSKISADLYVDCTGFKSLLLGEALNEPFDSFESMLPNNRAWATRMPYKDKERELEPFTNSTAIQNGWCWNIPLWSRLGTGYVYSDKFINPEDALEEFKQHLMSDKMIVPRTREEVDALEYRDIKMRVGIHKRTFVKNVVAIGLSAGFIEPLESNGLFSVHEFLFRLIDVLDRGEKVSQFDRDMYNSTVRGIFEDFSRFVAMHYSLSHRDDTEYWKSVSERSFVGVNEDEFYDYKLPKSQSFYDLSQRFLNNWVHPMGPAGITYISVGMNMFMVNNNRMSSYMLTNSGMDYLPYTNEICNIWEARKAKWNRNAQNSPTLYEYLLDNFYKDSNDL